jgi:hypothetical protein
MADVKWKNSEELAEDMSEFFAKQARIELQAKHTRTSIRGSWKKVGNKWRAVGSRRKTFRGNYVASGRLVNSIQPERKGTNIAISMLWYAQAIEEGRKPWRGAGFKGGKGLKPSVIDKWTRRKGFRPRDKDGQFIANNDRNRKAQGFLMNRKIKNFGIEPFPFVDTAQDSTIAVFERRLKKMAQEDIQNALGA